jgi:hypothetical protein
MKRYRIDNHKLITDFPNIAALCIPRDHPLHGSIACTAVPLWEHGYGNKQYFSVINRKPNSFSTVWEDQIHNIHDYLIDLFAEKLDAVMKDD